MSSRRRTILRARTRMTPLRGGSLPSSLRSHTQNGRDAGQDAAGRQRHVEDQLVHNYSTREAELPPCRVVEIRERQLYSPHMLKCGICGTVQPSLEVTTYSGPLWDVDVCWDCVRAIVCSVLDEGAQWHHARERLHDLHSLAR